MSGADDKLFGIHAVLAALRNEPDRIERVWFDEGRQDARLHELVEETKRMGVRFVFVGRPKLDELAAQGRHQGVVARVQSRPLRDEQDLVAFLGSLEPVPFLLVLDEVQDPHNLGACLRSAEAAGVQAVVVPRAQSAPVTAVVSRVSCGAAERLPIFQVSNLARALGHVREAGLWVVGTAADAPDVLFAADLRVPVALVLGGEERGLRRLTREQCDLMVHLPLLGSIPSLNVSVAAGICLYEVVRQRRTSVSGRA